MGNKTAILQKIKALRIENDIAVSDIAGKLGFKSTKGYYDMESGRSKLTIEKLEQIAVFYKIKLGIFFDSNSTETERKEGDTDPAA